MGKYWSHTPEAIEKIRRGKLGDKNPAKRPEVREKIRRTVLALYESDPTYRERVRKNTIKAIQRPDVRKRYEEGIKRRSKDPEFRRKVSEGVLRKLKEDPEIIEKIKKARLRQTMPQKQTKIEVCMQKGLKRKGLNFETHLPMIGHPDIAFPEKKVAIFCDGCYWHACPVHYPWRSEERDMEKDGRIEKALTEMGWTVLRFWEHEINENLEGCINKVMGVVM